MKIQITQIKENPDGSAECALDLDAEGHTLLMEVGFNFLLKSALECRDDGQTLGLWSDVKDVPVKKPRKKSVK